MQDNRIKFFLFFAFLLNACSDISPKEDTQKSLSPDSTDSTQYILSYLQKKKWHVNHHFSLSVAGLDDSTVNSYYKENVELTNTSAKVFSENCDSPTYTAVKYSASQYFSDFGRGLADSLGLPGPSVFIVNIKCNNGESSGISSDLITDGKRLIILNNGVFFHLSE